ncbi:vitamin K epoxide reductase family protein [Chitinophaga sp. LS1]|uniref:vitamin K epoxide reductase family protein n=1 Tax=Chitinophaga sp. LS1 TaxID=3051176 RepID=UPI002AABCC35|nr:vitamin K epoxide reductase family protein [Chitinophaga sp. LS1]WPV64032.1 vitamin K epoxide reductase family protein [Chitinophaga sp. LS1]
MFRKLFINPRENCVEATSLLFESLNASVTFTTIEKRITSHPNYPSAICISDFLDSLKIHNLSFTVTEEFLDRADDPFLTLIHSDQYHIDMYTIVKPGSHNKLSYFDPDLHSWKTLSHKDFIPKWNRDFVMMFQAEGPVIEEDYKANLFAERRQLLFKYLAYTSLPLLSIFAIALNFIMSGAKAVNSSMYLLLSIAGCITTILLLGFDVDKHNHVLKNICGKGRKINCSAILGSKFSKIAGISWSAIGFTYFAGQLLLGLFNIFTNQSAIANALFFTNALALPYTIYSISFQTKAKVWCSLCLVVQILLALQFTVNITSGWYYISHLNTLLEPQLLALVVLAYSLPAITLSILMPNLISAKEGRYTQKEIARLKHNPQVFDLLLKQQKQLIFSPNEMGIKIGSGNKKIIKVCNPYCIPCSNAHKHIEEILRTNPDVEVQIIYWISPTEESSNIVKHLIAIEKLYGPEKLKEALDDWYLTENKVYDNFAMKYPIDGAFLKQEEALGLMHNWCTKEEISFTPTFYINGFRIPGSYNVTDLKFLLAS